MKRKRTQGIGVEQLEEKINRVTLNIFWDLIEIEEEDALPCTLHWNIYPSDQADGDALSPV